MDQSIPEISVLSESSPGEYRLGKCESGEILLFVLGYRDARARSRSRCGVVNGITEVRT